MQPDGQPTGTPHMFHRGNAKHPALSSTSESSAHLGCRCTVSRKEARGCCTVLHACMDAGDFELLSVSIFTQRTLVLYIEAVHTCVYVYNQMGRGSFVGGRREGDRRNFTGVDTISHWELDSVWKGVEARHLWRKRSWFRSVEDKHTDGRRCSDHYIGSL